jgi:hypothetical protein
VRHRKLASDGMDLRIDGRDGGRRRGVKAL